MMDSTSKIAMHMRSVRILEFRINVSCPHPRPYANSLVVGSGPGGMVVNGTKFHTFASAYRVPTRGQRLYQYLVMRFMREEEIAAELYRSDIFRPFAANKVISLGSFQRPRYTERHQFGLRLLKVWIKDSFEDDSSEEEDSSGAKTALGASRDLALARGLKSKVAAGGVEGPLTPKPKSNPKAKKGLDDATNTDEKTPPKTLKKKAQGKSCPYKDDSWRRKARGAISDGP
ncbi:hypothetical protein BYT27DRAFT_7209529 [Phlegmacium glaucopus]|nr:hypothetical protein BYT27DRAFT_7209529 [Phlegmacium glaucopus]